LEINRIIFWQPIDSPHQESFLEAVAEQFSGEVILGVEQGLPAERVAQGWRKAIHKKVQVVDISISANHAALTAHSASDSVHVFTGFFSHPLVWLGFRKLAPSQARLAIMSEAPEQPLLTGGLKRLRGRLLARRWAHRFAFVLAIGGVGCKFFEAIGFPKEKIIPFGYYLDVPPLAATEESQPHYGVFRFISAGQLIHRKGIDILIKACGQVPAKGWHLDIYGDGPERASLERLTARLGLADRITFLGAAPNNEVQKALAAADCAVLPSRFDGWGALISEALSAGTPTICSAECGAAALLVDPVSGEIIRDCSPEGLGASMNDRLNTGRITAPTRDSIRAIAYAHSASSAAARVVAVIAGTN
jgi:glycosyltransferase involved in cell wall biosynthesis